MMNKALRLLTCLVEQLFANMWAHLGLALVWWAEEQVELERHRKFQSRFLALNLRHTENEARCFCIQSRH